MQLECEATGRKDCNYLFDAGGNSNTPQGDQPPNQQESVDSAQDTMPPQNVYYDNRSTTDYNVNNPPAQQEPAPRLEERCTFNALGIKIGCRQVPVD